MKIVICFVILRIVGVISDDEFSNFRLNNYLYPVHYDLQLDLFISDGYFKGTVDIEMKSEQEIPPSTSHIELNSNGLDLDSYSVKLMKEGKPLKLGVILEQNQLEKVTFLLNEDLETDTSYKLHIVFKRDFAVDEDVGLLLRSYTDGDNGTSNYYVAANLYPTYARTVFPCFDEPHFKATFNVTLTHTPEMKSVSTMPLLQTNFGLNTKGEKIVWNIFEQTPPISPSSIGLFISNMASQTRNGIIIWAANRERAEQISNLPHFEFFHAAMQEMTSIHLQIPLNFVFVPDLHVNAFESFGIVYIRSNDLEQELNVEWFIGSILADIMSNSQSFIVEIAKQVAVQYFDHMVTPKLWSDIWLRESLSEYYGFLMACKLDNDSSYENLIPPMLRNQVFDGSFENQQILLTGNFDTSKQLYRSLSSRSIISKGVSLLFMISDIFGNSIISHGVSSYLKKFFLGSATTQDLMNELGNQLKMNNILLPYNITLQKFLQPWLESEEEPILHVERIQDSDYSTLIISQIQSNNSMHNVGWYVPVYYISGRDINPIENWSGPHIENGKMTNEITIENASGVDDWIILNPEGTGLYRVAYDPVSWELLMNQLKRNLTEIPTAARSLLISDAFSLARDGIVHYSNALEVAEYLVNETSFLPWLSAFRAFEELESRLYYNGELFGSFRTYVSKFVQVLYQNLGFPSNNVDGSSYEEDYLTILLISKTIEWSCNYDIEDCIEKSLSTVKHYLSGNITKMEDEYIDAILCGGLSQADSKTWNEAFNFMNSSTIMRKSLISALGCSKHPHLIQSYLDKTLSADIIINKKYVLEVFEGIYSKHYNYEKALDFLGTNIGNIQLKYDNDTFNKILIGVSKYATTLDHFEKINQISSKIERNEDLMMELNRTLKHVQELENWMIVNGKHFREYFSNGNTEGEFSKSRNNGENILLLGVVVLYSTATNLF